MLGRLGGKAGGANLPIPPPGEEGPARLGPSPGFGPQMAGGLGRERPQTPLSEHRPDTHLSFPDNRLTGMEMGFPILGG